MGDVVKRRYRVTGIHVTAGRFPGEEFDASVVPDGSVDAVHGQALAESAEAWLVAVGALERLPVHLPKKPKE